MLKKITALFCVFAIIFSQCPVINLSAKDSQAPILRSSTPGKYQEGMQKNVKIKLLFSENIYKGSTFSKIKITKSGKSVSIKAKISKKYLYIDHKYFFVNNSYYVINIPINAIKDAAGNLIKKSILIKFKIRSKSNEVEHNGAFSTSNILKINTVRKGVISKSTDIDFNKIVIANNGGKYDIWLSLEGEQNGKYNKNYAVALYDSEYNLVINVPLTHESMYYPSSSIELFEYPLQAGTYYMKVYSFNYNAAMSNITYSLQCNAFAPGYFDFDYKYESEPNDSYNLSTSLADGDYGEGQLLNSNDTDIYDFTIDKADDCEFVFALTNLDYFYYLTYINVKLYDSNFQFVADFQDFGEVKELINYHLEAGHYYISINSNNFKPMMPFLQYVVANITSTKDNAEKATCMDNLRTMDGSIIIAEVNGDTVSGIADLVPKYIKTAPVCPSGGTYTFVKATSTEGAHFVCSIPGHELP